MAKARDFRIVATTLAAASVAFTSLVYCCRTASAEGLSIGLGASTASAPGGDGAAPAAAPPMSDASAARAAPSSPSPSADTGASSPSSDRASSKDVANYEFAFVSVAAYQSWSLAGNDSFRLSFGMGGGLGPPLYRYSHFNARSGDPKNLETVTDPKTMKTSSSFQPTKYPARTGWDPSLEIAYANAFLRVSIKKVVDVDLGPKIAIGSALYDVQGSPTPYFSFGGYVDLRVGSEKIKIGPRFEYDRVAYYSFFENGWRLTPLLLRVVH